MQPTIAKILARSSSCAMNKKYFHGHFQTCHMDYIPNTTWTEGRNLLVRHILNVEEQQGQKFDFWIFSDDDVDLRTYGGLQVQRELWAFALHQLDQVFLVPDGKISQITSFKGESGFSRGGWVGVSTYDANLVIFSRWAVPYLLPYAVPRPGDSEWISQAVLFCVTKICFPSSVA